jgi:D-xylose transport system substrate-binding protein
MSFRSILMVVSLALSVAIGMALRGAGGGGGADAGSGASRGARKIKIGLSLDTLKEARWQSDRDAFIARAKSLGADIDVQSANSDDSVQIQNITGLLSSGVDVLVVVAHNGEAMAKAVELGHAQGIPVIAYDRLIKSADLDLYVTFDNYKVGVLQSQFVLDQIPKVGHRPMRIVRILGSKADNNAVILKTAQDELLGPAIARGDIQMVQEDWAEDWKPEAAKRIMNAALTKAGHDIDLVLASNDGTAGGAIQALTEEGLAGKVIVTGQDAELVACQRIVQGTQAMTIYKPLVDLASRAAELAFALGQRRPVIATSATRFGNVEIPTVLLPVYITTRENMMTTVVKDGFHTEKEIYGK